MSNGQGYATRYLEHRDYYAEGERVVGHWQGRGAAQAVASHAPASGEYI